MASSPQLSGQSIVSRMRSESSSGNLVPGNLPFFLFCFFYFFKIVFGRFVSCPILNQDQKQSVMSFYSCSSFKFNTLEKVSIHLLARLPFSYSLKFRTRIGTLLNLNIFKSNNKVFVVKLLQGQNTSFKESLFPCSLQYELNLLHIILKFTLHSWQVPRSSVGRALYRESGPSQDGDPVPGNLPFFVFFLFLQFF